MDSYYQRPHPICLCKNVFEEEIINAIQNGAKTVKEVSKKTKAGTGCGTCIPKIQKLIDTNG